MPQVQLDVRASNHDRIFTDFTIDENSAHSVTPILDSRKPTPHRVGFLIHAFRMRLGRIGGFTTQDIEDWLHAQGWELDVAVERFWQVTVPLARAAHETSQPDRSQIQQWKDNMLAGAAYSRHGNHRRTISVLYEMMQDRFPGDVITVLRLANLLRETLFDYQEATIIHEQRRGNVVEMAEIDRAERRLCMPGLNGDSPTQVHKDTRVQIFLEGAGTDDWISVREFLSSPTITWNLGRAFDRWMQIGLPTAQATSKEFRRARYRAPQLPHTEQDNLWPSPRPLFQMTAPDDSDIANSIENYGTGPYVGEVSRYINLDLEKAVVGINRPDLLEQFSLNQGRGTVIPILADGIPEGDSMVPMSFYNKIHITALNKAYLQNPRRSAGVMKRQAGIHYTYGECDWIYCWYEDRVMQYQVRHTGFVLPTGKTWKDFVDFNVEELTEDFNHEFQGRVTIGSSLPRPERQSISLEVKRSRIQILCTDFGFN